MNWFGVVKGIDVGKGMKEFREVLDSIFYTKFSGIVWFEVNACNKKASQNAGTDILENQTEIVEISRF